MNSKKIIINGISSIIAQIITIIAQFLVRRFFIKYVGEELLGLDSAILSILNILSMAEAGLSSALIVYLVQPLQQNNKSEVNQIVNTFGIMYKVIGLIYLILSLVIMPFLRFFITGINIGNILYIYYIFLAINGASTYFLSYRRVIVYADQKMYVQKIADSICCLIFSAIQILILIYSQQYIWYIFARIVQTISTNGIIYLWCKKNYSFLRKEKVNLHIVKKMFGDMKNLFAGQVAAYVYNSSDSLIISKAISTVLVTFYNNYYLIAYGLKSLLLSLFNAMVPWIKGITSECQDKQRDFKVFKLYTHFSFLLVAAVIVPSTVIIDDFISMWVGNKFILSGELFFLMMLDMYVCVMQSPTGNYIIAHELFRYSKYPDIIGAIANIIISIVLVNYLGLVGVLLGTVVSRFIQWEIRTYISYKWCFGLYKRDIALYNFDMLLRLFIILFCIALSFCVTNLIPIGNVLKRICIEGIIAEVITIVSVCIIYIKNEEQQKIFRILFKG